MSHQRMSRDQDFRCSLCGCVRYDTLTFKKGYVCENCIAFLREDYLTDPAV